MRRLFLTLLLGLSVATATLASTSDSIPAPQENAQCCIPGRYQIANVNGNLTVRLDRYSGEVYQIENNSVWSYDIKLRKVEREGDEKTNIDASKVNYAIYKSGDEDFIINVNTGQTWYFYHKALSSKLILKDIEQ